MSTDSERERLRGLYESQPTEDLVQVVRERGEFRPEAVAVVRELLVERGVAVDEIGSEPAPPEVEPSATERPEPGGDGIVQQISRAPVTATTVAAAAAVSLAFWTGSDITPLVMTRDAFSTQPWRLLTPALAHLDVLHFLFNAYWTWSFGRVIESRFGSTRTMALYALLAAGSSAAEFALFHGGVGLSGVVYGLFALLWVLSRRADDVRGAMNRRVIHLFVGWFFFCIAATALGLWNVGNVAHGAGALLGALIGMAMTARPEHVVRWRAALVGSLGLLWVLGTVARPYVNLADALFYDYCGRAAAANEDGDYRAAAALYLEAIAIDDQHHDAFFDLGLTLTYAGEYERALEEFGQAARLAPEDAESAYMRAWCLGELGRNGRALEVLARALELDPRHALSHARTGWTMAQLGRFEEALGWLEQGTSLDPWNAVVHAWRGWVLTELGRYEGSLAALDRALELDPEDGWHHALRGSALAGLGRFDEALAANDRALELDPASAGAWVGRSWILATAGRFEEGLEATERALELDLEYEDAHLNRGWVLLELGRYKEAIAECDAVLARNPRNVQASENRAAAVRALEDE